MYAYLDRKIAERRVKPGADVLTAMLQARIDGGRPLTEQEMLGMGALVLAAGLDSRADGKQTTKFSMRARLRRHRDGRHAG